MEELRVLSFKSFQKGENRIRQNEASLLYPENRLKNSHTLPLGVRVPNNHILCQNLHQNHDYSNPKSLIIGYLDPLGTHENWAVSRADAEAIYPARG